MDRFQGFPKIARLNREVIVTEKIDGTNAQIFIGENGTFLTGSRNRWITPENDNHGFSRWAHDHKAELMTLGPGRHFGEWWGAGIQRGYGFAKGEKRFSLFNVTRWCLYNDAPRVIPSNNPKITKTQDVLPPCVGLVPVLWRGMFDALDTNVILTNLCQFGSKAAPGFMKPEGIVIFHTAGNICFKKTVENDALPKSITNTKR